MLHKLFGHKSPATKQVHERVENLCKTSLWNGETQVKWKALIAWERFWLLKVLGGINVTDNYMWNKGAIQKHLLNQNKKKDKLWIVWVHTFYLKGRKPWRVRVN